MGGIALKRGWPNVLPSGAVAAVDEHRKDHAMTTRKSYGAGFDKALRRAEGDRFKRWYDATSRVAGRT